MNSDTDNKYTPPKLANWLLQRFLKEDLAEEVQGDLEEKYKKLVSQRSVLRAKLNYWYQVLNYLRPFAIKNYRSNSNFIEMNTYNIKIAFRQFLKHKTTFFINLFGLTTGLASALLISLWVLNELSVDTFHKNSDNLYKVMINHQESGAVSTGAETPALISNALEAEIPEVKNAILDTDPDWFGDQFVIKSNDESYKVRGKFTESDFFKLFSYPFRKGSTKSALTNNNSIVISEELALKLFNSTDVIGKTVSWQIHTYKGEAEITGVMQTFPVNSTETFDMALPMDYYLELAKQEIAWSNFNTVTYVELHDDTTPGSVNNKIEDLIKKKDESSNATPFLFKYSDQYLYGQFENGQSVGGRIKYVKLFALIAIFIIVIACVNFMNLTTAKASLRLKEIGMKKALGVKRVHLIVQFITESVVLSFISLLVAIALVNITLPVFNELTEKSLSFQLTQDLFFVMIGIMLFTGLLAGSYPALFLSRFEAIKILRGNLSFGSQGVFIRKSLVIFQFTISIVLIVGVIVVTQQIGFLQKQNLGYDRENILIMPLEGKAIEKLSTFINEIERVKGVTSASASSHDFISGLSFTTGISWKGKNPEEIVRFERARVYNNLTKTMGITLVEGRDFFEGGNETDKIIFNETAIKTMGLSNPIGQKVIMWGKEKEIIGVVADFHFQSLHHEVAPMFIHYGEEELYMTLIRIESDNIQNTLADLKKVYSDFNPGGAFNFSFLDDDYQRLYDSETRIAGLGKIFAVLAIFISCLGLFGLATFTAERRIKEISIRKVLGAPIWNILALLQKEFSLTILLSILIAIPIGYLVGNSYLDSFAYKIEISWWHFALSGAIILLIAWATISVQTLKAALSNPVESLKNE